MSRSPTRTKNRAPAASAPMGWSRRRRFRCSELNKKSVLGVADAMVEQAIRDGWGHSLAPHEMAIVRCQRCQLNPEDLTGACGRN